MYICEAMGMEDFVKEFNKEEEALQELERFVQQFTEDNDGIEEWSDMYNVCDYEFTCGYSEHYQACFVYKKPETVKEEMMMEITRAEYGLEQYTFELMDSGTCSGHLWNLRKMIEENM